MFFVLFSNMNHGELKVPSPFGRPSSDTQNLVLSELSLFILPQNIENKILGLQYIGARLQYIGAPKCSWLTYSCLYLVLLVLSTLQKRKHCKINRGLDFLPLYECWTLNMSRNSNSKPCTFVRVKFLSVGCLLMLLVYWGLCRKKVQNQPLWPARCWDYWVVTSFMRQLRLGE